MNRVMIPSIKRGLQRLRTHGWAERLFYFVAGGVLMAVGVPIIFVVGIMVFYSGKAYPNIEVAGLSAEGLSSQKLHERLYEEVVAYDASIWPLTVTADAHEVVITPTPNAVEYDLRQTVASALAVGRSGSVTERIRAGWSLVSGKVAIPVVTRMDEQWWSEAAASVSAVVDTPAVTPTAEVVSGKVVVRNGVLGTVLDSEEWRNTLLSRLQHLESLPSELPMTSAGYVASEDQLAETQRRAESLLQKTLTLTLDGEKADVQNWQLRGSELVSFLHVGGGFERTKVSEYVRGVADSVNRPAQDAKFSFDPSVGRVSEFTPARDGLAVDEGETSERLMRALGLVETAESMEPVRLQVTHTKPQMDLADVNQLGIKELIGRGTSTYFHSIPTRVHNVALAASRINGVLVKPGETFSFNAAVGDVSAATGYQQAYIIQAGRTVLGDGGGVCQDSTTIFRAALDAGLPIVERRGHAYRVGYYEQNTKAGIDATVFSPTTDFKFLNDTPGYILIQATADSKNYSLVVDLYGTSDGRKSEISNHVVWDITPPPPDIYQDDPTLKTGVVKQVDWKAQGAKAKFDYTVRRGGQDIYQKTFLTVYRPWASVFLRGVGP